MRKPAARNSRSGLRFRWQPPAIRFQRGVSLSCQVLTAILGAVPCSAKSLVPPCFITRCISRSSSALSYSLHLFLFFSLSFSLTSQLHSLFRISFSFFFFFFFFFF